jgi:hypothetical protein
MGGLAHFARKERKKLCLSNDLDCLLQEAIWDGQAKLFGCFVIND